MRKINILKNPVQEYSWGSMTAIQDFIGQPVPSEKPVAELWMGAHPVAPSKVKVDGDWKSLDEVIKRAPEPILGKRVAEKFSNKLPFLFKILAVAGPLSLQAHPDHVKAQAGFEMENLHGISVNSPERNYRDNNHKPEMLFALRPFQILKGFRKIEEILALMDRVSPSIMSYELDFLRKGPEADGLRLFFSEMMNMGKARQGLLVNEAISRAIKYVDEDHAYRWMLKLSRDYPGDICIFSPLIFNLLQLRAGEAVYLPSGEIHAYLEGFGIELMANSDNVLRGGLTFKKRDIPELLTIVDFKAMPVKLLQPLQLSPCERSYPTPAEEFVLSEISVGNGKSFTSQQDRNVEILICQRGKIEIKDLKTGDVIILNRGMSVIIPSMIAQYQIEGDATLFKASVPV